MKRLPSLLAFLLLPLFTFAQDPNDIVSVTATGYGTSPENAVKAAARAAVEQVVGQLVDAETLVENDELVKDRILTYSGAYLEDMDVVGTPAQADGLWTVKVLAKVRKTQLQQKLVAENIGKAALKKGKLFAQATSKAQEAEDAGAMIRAAFEGFPKNVVRFEVCKNDDGSPAVSVSDADGNVCVDVILSIDADAWKSFAKGLIQKLDVMSSQKEDATWSAASAFAGRQNSSQVNVRIDRNYIYCTDNSLSKRWERFDRVEGFRLAVAQFFRGGASAFGAREYLFSGNNEKTVRDAICKSLPGNMELTVSLMADDELLESKTYSFYSYPGAMIFSMHGNATSAYGRNVCICLLPVFGSCGDDSARYAPGSVRMTLPLGPISADILSEATDIATSVKFYVSKRDYYMSPDWEPMTE